MDSWGEEGREGGREERNKQKTLGRFIFFNAVSKFIVIKRFLKKKYKKLEAATFKF